MFSGVAPPPCRWHMLQLEILKHVWLRGTLNENRRKETEFWGKWGISFMMLGWLHSVRKLTADWTLEYSGVVSKEWPHVRECNHVTMLIEGVKLLLSIRCILVPCSLCPYTEDSRWLSDKHSVPHTSHFWSRVTSWDKWRNKETLKAHTGAVFIFVILLYSCFFYVFETIFYFTSFKMIKRCDTSNFNSTQNRIYRTSKNALLKHICTDKTTFDVHQCSENGNTTCAHILKQS